jgi:serine/threonine-protein kinase
MSDLLEHIKDAFRNGYAIDREIGHGGMATVYLALDPKHNRKVAVKVLLSEFAKSLTAARFLQEIEMAAGLAHPNIVPVYDSGEADGFLYYVMPFIDGEDLQHCLREQGRLPVERAVQIAREVASALSYAHKQNIIHRDIKPGNILFVEGHAMVTDFGIGKAMCDVCEDDITLIGGLVGTPHYMSPEQAGGDPVDQRTDVYSLGCVLYEMLSGELPYPADNAQAAMARHAIDPVPSIRVAHPEVPAQLDTIVTKALAKQPDERFESATEFAAALGRVGKLQNTGMWHGPPTTDAPPVSPSPARTNSKTRIAAALAAIAVIAGGWWALASGGNTRSIESLAVLPFTNLSGDAEQEYFVDGMHDLLISELAQIGALTVISRTSVLQYRGTDRSVPDIARELGVDAVVEGSVYRGGDSVRINVQLIAARPERHLWADVYAGTVESMFALQAEVARAVAREIEAELTPQEEARLAAVQSIDHDVHDAYLLARFHHAKGTVAGFEEAIRYYNEAIERSPDFAPAHAGLALSLHLLGVYGGLPAAETEPRAMMHAEAALDLDEDLAEAHAVLAGIKSMYEWDWAAAERAYSRAIEVDRSSAIARQWYAYHLTSVGRHDEAIAQAQRGLELDPLNPMGRVILADQLVNARRYDEAISALWIYTQLDRYDEAVQLRLARLAGMGTGGALAARMLQQSYATSGSQGYWQWKLQQLQRAGATGYVGPNEFAKVYAALGDGAAAMSWLARAYDERDGVEMLKVWPGYDPLRGSPEFEDLLRRMNFPD